MKICVVGAGAVGGYYGAALKNAGLDVTFIARGAHLEKMNEKGLEIRSPQETYTVYGAFTNDIKAVEKADLILFTVKSTETRTLAEEIAPYLKKDASVLTLQNGVDNEEVLAEVLGENRIVAGVTYVSTKVVEPGVIQRFHEIQTIVMGALSETNSSAATWRDLLHQANVDVEIADSIVEKKWAKLLWNATFNPLSAAALASVGDILDEKHLRTTAETILEEALSVGRALGITFEQEWVDQIFPLSEVARAHKTSMLQDRESGKKMEVESLCGYFVRKGSDLGVPTPTIRTLYAILSSINEQVGNKVSTTKQ
ncbi:ketopantoate reductase family protein [Alkalihalobacterium chitinilyticum]|uniref:2-dehydropantoate 2-reductase n=1 Tax=Alkalihalobacterium chitinilyticum TaxID=2980103 RepID=A0ABT5VKK2_9BACI|nr:2-dehydropantoate 2-reductase [Alkalihalobacterium chitinilyticum]MDE5415944.1 2-dehydropantoate 2-reductase [Alkalihalobacterium chitinilyticum]